MDKNQLKIFIKEYVNLSKKIYTLFGDNEKLYNEIQQTRKKRDSIYLHSDSINLQKYSRKINNIEKERNANRLEIAKSKRQRSELQTKIYKWGLEYNSLINNNPLVRKTLSDFQDTMKTCHNEIDKPANDVVFIGIINFFPFILENKEFIETLSLFLNHYYIRNSYDDLLKICDWPENVYLNKNTKTLLNSINASYWSNYITFLASDILLNNEDMTNKIIDGINNSNIGKELLSTSNFLELKNVFDLNPNINIKLLPLLFPINDKTLMLYNKSNDLELVKRYLHENIDDDKVVGDIIAILESGNIKNELLKEIEMVYKKNSEAQQIGQGYSCYDLMRVSILYCIREKEFVMNVMNSLKQTYSDDNGYNVLNNSRVLVALFKAKTIEHKNRLLSFLEIPEVRNDILKEESFYNNLLLKTINTTEITDYGSYKDIFTYNTIDLTNENIKKKIIDFFVNLNVDKLYFYSDNKIKALSISLYVPFLTNILYKEQCIFDFCEDIDFCNEMYFDKTILQYLVNNDYINASVEMIRLNLGKGLNYYVNNQIYWNNLLNKTFSKQDEERKKLIKAL